MTKMPSIDVDDRSRAYIETQIAQGSYRDPSEVVAAGLRLLEERDLQRAALRAALIEGEKSGLDEPFDVDDFLVEMHEKHPSAG